MYSRYKDSSEADRFNTQWAQAVQQLNGLSLQARTLATDWGPTRVWVHTPRRRIYETLIFLPGFNASSLVWLTGQNLNRLSKKYRLCLVDINGQPGLSAGLSPLLQTDEYGCWARQVLEQLGTARATLIGHALGALISLKACRMAPELIKKAILVNPAGLQSLSLSLALLRYYRLAIQSPSERAVRSFLRETVFSSLDPPLAPAQEQLLVDFQVYNLRAFAPAQWWHQALSTDELVSIQTPIYVVLGAQDKLYPYQTTQNRAVEHLPSLVSVTVLPTMGHSVQSSSGFGLLLETILTQ
ncbi:alpha/beta fold hydrolase [Spirosoma utsteinense]|uniref:Pimeloyl-ACP methyl ester carboxylesterase n=1 Tax=Spirosoma utsteinense TaxID=2585773 RepID=A0ABR6WDJ6_9BACT|nr:alpha/beta hydrolase [Spirosoma utsteinense]MBC3784221.1 pimeloyl-ACP methyl ester carboxylesterase [Spirosoma utsteinense]MBC3793992.1 pimeloyl-ACP methyl ester carboxylesterase [Spirosoma utsteinense]